MLLTLLVLAVSFGVFAYGIVKIRNGWVASAREPPATRAILRQLFGGWAIGLLFFPVAGLWYLGLSRNVALSIDGLAGVGVVVMLDGFWRGRSDPRFQNFVERWYGSWTGRIA
jgi:hypothetical protein